MARRNDIPPPSPDWEEWPKLEEAAQTIGISSRQLQKWLKTGKAERHPCPDGTYRYNPKHLAELQGISEDEIEEAELSTAQLITAMGAYLRTQNDHIKMLVHTIVEPLKANFDGWKAQSEQSNARILALEAKWLESILERERLLSEGHERELAAKESEASIRRKDQTLDVLRTQVVPAIVKSVAAKNPKAQAAVELLQTIDSETIDALLQDEVEFLTPDQKAKLRVILDRPTTPTGRSNQKQETGETDNG